MDFDPGSLLRGQIVLRTKDVREFHDHLSEYNGRVERQVAESSAFEVDFRHTSLGRIDFGVHYCSVDMSVSARRSAGDHFLLQLALSGGFEVRVGQKRIIVPPGEGALIPPGCRVSRIGRPGWTMLFRIPGSLVRSRLELHLRHGVNKPFAFDVSVGPAFAAELVRFGRVIMEAIDKGIAKRDTAVALSLEESLVELLLKLQPHSRGAELAESELATRTERIRKVTDYVDRHLAGPIRVRQLAEAAGCGTRALQSTFADLCHVAPLEYVRQYRLRAARKMLETAGPDTTVSHVAQRTGFAHQGRFAREYRGQFGEIPSETLRRGLGRT